MASGKNILLVEGKDDQHVVYAIRDFYSISKDAFTIQEKQGIDNLFEGLEVNLIEGSSAVGRIGVVIDADLNLISRWQTVSSILRKANYQNLPVSPDENGTVVKQEFLPTFGVWIMPDNKITRGFLETFLTFLVPENDAAWQQAKDCVAKLENKPFVKTEADHTQKAEIHTFLAWQEEPGKPFGQAITAKYLQADSPQAQIFADWLKRLFVD